MSAKTIRVSVATYNKLQERKGEMSFEEYISCMLRFFSETETDPRQIKMHPTMHLMKEFERLIKISKAQEKTYFKEILSGVKHLESIFGTASNVLNSEVDVTTLESSGMSVSQLEKMVEQVENAEAMQKDIRVKKDNFNTERREALLTALSKLDSDKLLDEKYPIVWWGLQDYRGVFCSSFWKNLEDLHLLGIALKGLPEKSNYFNIDENSKRILMNSKDFELIRNNIVDNVH